MSGAIREAREIPIAIRFDHEDIVFAIATGTGLAVGYRNHRLHRDHHPGLEHRIAVFPQLETGFPAVVMTKYAERMTVAERAILQ